MMIDTPPAEIRPYIKGTVLGTDGITAEGFRNALNVGYAHIDSAMVYGSHTIIADVMDQLHVPRYLLTIATKIPGSKLDIHNLAASTEAAVETCLKELNTEYIDVMYLHGPDAFQPEVLDVLQKFKDQKKIFHIGLSNATTEQVAAIRKLYDITIVQVEFNPYSWDESLLNYCLDNKIELIGYRPFRREDSQTLLNDPKLVAIASKIQTTVSQLILQWARQKGVLPVARANLRDHLESNFKPMIRFDNADDANTHAYEDNLHYNKYHIHSHGHKVRDIDLSDHLIFGKGRVLEILDSSNGNNSTVPTNDGNFQQQPKYLLTDEEMAAIDALNQHNPSCLWQQYSDPVLISRSEEWLNSL